MHYFFFFVQKSSKLYLITITSFRSDQCVELGLKLCVSVKLNINDSYGFTPKGMSILLTALFAADRGMTNAHAIANQILLGNLM